MARILYLDDEAFIVDFVCRMLQSSGYQAVGTTNVHEALLILNTQPIDLFMQDMARPVMYGEELVRLLKDEEKLRYVPVVLLTGFPKEACHVYRAGGSAQRVSAPRHHTRSAAASA